MIKRKSSSMKAGLLVMCMVLFFLVPQVFAQGNIHLGRLKVEPGITYKGEYNDNIYSAKTDEEDDYINTVTPSVRFSYIGSAPGNFFNAGYGVDLVAYSDNGDNNYQAHKPYMAMGLKTPAGLYLRASDNFLHTKDPYGTDYYDTQSLLGGSIGGYGVGAQTERWNNAAEVAAGYDFFERYTLELMYKNYAERFDLADDEWQDRTDDVYGASFFVKLTGKTSVFLQYRKTDAEYDSQNDGIPILGATPAWNSTNSQDYRLNDYFIGAKFEPGGKLSGEVKLGYGNKKFDNEYDNTGHKYEDKGSWVAETTVTYQPAQRTRLSLNVYRSHKGSPDADASSYLDTLVGLSLNQELANRLSFNLGVEWINYDYLNEVSGSSNKYFNIYTIKGGLGYKIQDWLTAGLRYEYKSKKASDGTGSSGIPYENLEYDTNILSVSLSAVF